MGAQPGEPAHIEAPAVVLRPGTPADLDYVYSTWLRSYLQHGATLSWARNGGPAAKARYYRGQQALVARLLGDGAQLLVAGLPADETTVLGWACYSGTVGGSLHYVYTRQALRRAGVARTLLRAVAPAEYTHLCQAPRGERGRGAEWTDWLAEWMQREWPVCGYNPYAAIGG